MNVHASVLYKHTQVNHTHEKVHASGKELGVRRHARTQWYNLSRCKSTLPLRSAAGIRHTGRSGCQKLSGLPPLEHLRRQAACGVCSQTKGSI